MQAAPQLPTPLTVDAYLAWAGVQPDGRFELVEGVIVAMAAPSWAHSTIAGNLAGMMYGRLPPGCRVRIEYGLSPAGSEADYYQADLVVVCGERRRGEPQPDPVLVVEIASRSTFAHDRGRKVGDYRQLPGCRCILVVESERRRVERWDRDGSRWVVQDHIEGGAVPIELLGLSLDLAEIYAGADLEG